jgi:hypothetical protein
LSPFNGTGPESPGPDPFSPDMHPVSRVTGCMGAMGACGMPHTVREFILFLLKIICDVFSVGISKK